MFCVFSSAMDLVLNHLMKFITRSPNIKGYVGRQLLWLTNLVWTLAKKCCFFASNLFGATSYRSQVENPETEHCYLNSSMLDKFIWYFREQEKWSVVISSDQIKFIIEKQVRETDLGQVYELQTKCDGKSNDRVSESKQQQWGGGTDRLKRESRKSWLQNQLECTTPGFILVKSKKSHTAKIDAETTLKKEESSTKRFRNKVS